MRIAPRPALGSRLAEALSAGQVKMRREAIDAFLAADPLHSAGVYKEVRPGAGPAPASALVAETRADCRWRVNNSWVRVLCSDLARARGAGQVAVTEARVMWRNPAV
jgi:hypothetical protein